MPFPVYHCNVYKFNLIFLFPPFFLFFLSFSFSFLFLFFYFSFLFSKMFNFTSEILKHNVQKQVMKLTVFLSKYSLKMDQMEDIIIVHIPYLTLGSLVYLTIYIIITVNTVLSRIMDNIRGQKSGQRLGNHVLDMSL
jgi:hypothetical protein